MKTLFIILAAFFSKTTLASTIYWQQLNATKAISEKFSLYGEFQPRWIDNFSRTQLLILRTAFLYKIDPQFSIGLGYGWTPQFYPSKRNENRIYQQFEWKPVFSAESKWAFTSRARLEERLLQFTSGPSFRFREKAQINWMLFSPKAGLYLWDEIFFNLNSKQDQVGSGFDQNRVSAGLRFKQEFTFAELGFINQVVHSSIQNRTTKNVGILLSVAVNIP